MTSLRAAVRVTAAAFGCALVAAAQEIPRSTAATDVASLRAAVAAAPDNAGLKLRLAKAVLDASEKLQRAADVKKADDEVAALFDAVLKINPDAQIPLRSKIRDAYYRRRFEEVVEVGKRLLAVEPEDVDMATLYVKALIRLDRDEEAAAFFLDWVKSGLGPSSGTVQGLLTTFVLRPKVRQALDAGFVRITQESPRNTLARLAYAGFLAETGRNDEAWKEFQRAEVDGLCDTNLGSRHAFALNLAARAMETATPASAAGDDLEELKKAVAGLPDHAGLRFRLARRLERATERLPEADPKRTAASEAALVEYRKACAINPEAWSAQFRAGELLLELGKPAESLPYFAQATTLFPGYVPWRLAEAEAKVANGDEKGAAESFVAYARRFESDPLVRRLAARLEKRGKTPWKAFSDALAAAAAKEPKNVYLRSNLAYFLLKQGDTAGARTAAGDAERLGLVGRGGLHAHPALLEAYGLPLVPESAPAPSPTGK